MYLIESIINFNSAVTVLDFLVIILFLLLIGFVITMLYKVNNDYKNITNSENIKKDSTSIDLQSISREIESAPPKTIELTEYEKEQEEKAIISYDELLENTGQFKINYEDEGLSSNGLIKKIDFDNVASVDTSSHLELEKAPVISYKREEAFLMALKELNQTLN